MKREEVRMKKFAVAVMVVSIVALAAVAYGQMGGHGMAHGQMGGQGMAQGMGCGQMGGHGMGQGMMGGHGMGGRMMDGEHHMWRRLAGLNLDEQQKAAVSEIKSRMMKETVKRKADVGVARIELKELLAKDPVDMKAVEAKLKQSETLKTEMRLSHIKAMEEVKAKLTPEQRKKFSEMVETGPAMKGMGMMHGQDCCMTKS
jgi:Spy/CpxP family protein refolding chaperone